MLFENLSDPIITGRDDVGFPKLFADIEVAPSDEFSVAISISWRGYAFGHLQIDGFREEPAPTENGPVEAKPRPGPPPPPPEQGTLVYRYVPAVGEPGEADAEYAVLCPYPASPPPAQKLVSQSASIKFTAGNWQSLPTLYHVTRKLTEMPIYGIEKAEKVSGVGVDGLSGAVGIE